MRFSVDEDLTNSHEKVPKVVPESWREDVKIRKFLDNVGSQTARMPLAEYWGPIDGIAVKTQQLR